jgi:hypothetical protein
VDSPKRDHLENTLLVVDGLKKDPLSETQARFTRILRKRRYFIKTSPALEQRIIQDLRINKIFSA